MIHILCKTSDIKDPGSKSFELKIEQKTHSIFVVHKNGIFSAYYNHCPHTGINLEWQENQFLDLENELIQCSTHGALFLTDTGECIAGPCVGQFLRPITIKHVSAELHLKI